MKSSIAAKLAEIRERENDRLVRTMEPQTLGTERHYTPEEISELWQVHVTTVRRIFGDRPDVLRVGSHAGRRYQRLRIPESVLHRVHAEMSK